MSTIGYRIRCSRESLGITQGQLGKLCGTTKQTIFKYENDIITNIPMDRIEMIATSLNVTPSYLMGWSDTSTLPSLAAFERQLELSAEEQDLIRKYRRLDERGRSAVRNILEHEYATLPGDTPASRRHA